ncbi:hypothetical protein [Rhizobium sp. AP16]|uniref:hypothetical protein n=1 Tax=Rhizobium sp. AP16 TaxID=1144306 RepID=UPI00026ED25C|nr:hypothetical protein [Rhizobium sp. AP16]EJK83553.1 hypothetical protein PMI03_03208 [Rhizobium sp. AP16]
MTIRERQERESHDRENPWRPMNTAPRGTGLICDLLFDDMMGHFAADGLQFFLDANGDWFQIDPPRRAPTPINWRPSYVCMSLERRGIVKMGAKYAKNS